MFRRSVMFGFRVIKINSQCNIDSFRNANGMRVKTCSLSCLSFKNPKSNRPEKCGYNFKVISYEINGNCLRCSHRYLAERRWKSTVPGDSKKHPLEKRFEPTALSSTCATMNSPSAKDTIVNKRRYVELLVSKCPQSVQPYLKLMRIDRPIGTWLLYWPCGWSIAMSASAGCLPSLEMLSLFAAGAFIMRGAGCTINDLWDRDIDKLVARTKDRPLVAGSVTPVDAIIFLMGQLGAGLLVLLQLNGYCVVLGASSLGLVIAYPLMKRITYWPQLILGLTFNWGALLGWAAVHGSVNWSVCLPLYVAGTCWTIFYDTIYAHQDKVDDVLLGIKSTAIKFGENTKFWLSGFGATMITGLLISGTQCGIGWPYYASVAVVASHLFSQVYKLNIDDPTDCAQKFFSNHQVGFIIFIGTVLGMLCKSKPKEEKQKSLN